MNVKQKASQRISAHRQRKIAAIRKEAGRRHGDGQRCAKLARVGIHHGGFTGGLIEAAMASIGVLW